MPSTCVFVLGHHHDVTTFAILQKAPLLCEKRLTLSNGLPQKCWDRPVAPTTH